MPRLGREKKEREKYITRERRNQERKVGERSRGNECKESEEGLSFKEGRCSTYGSGLILIRH